MKKYVEFDDDNGGTFMHRQVDAITAPRIEALGPNSPFAMGQRYLAGAVASAAEATADLAESGVAAPAPAAAAAPAFDADGSARTLATAAEDPARATEKVEEVDAPLSWMFCSTGAVRFSIGDQERSLSPLETRRFAAQLASHALLACEPNVAPLYKDIF